jgi:hypothetical protein
VAADGIRAKVRKSSIIEQIKMRSPYKPEFLMMRYFSLFASHGQSG